MDQRSPESVPHCADELRGDTVTETRPAAQGRTKADDRSPFDRFVHAAHLRVSRPGFFFICTAVILAWALSVPVWVDLKSWQVAIHTVASVVSLLLIALLENSGRRADEAAQEKLNVIAEALAALMASRAETDADLRPAVEKLRTAVGLEERH